MRFFSSIRCCWAISIASLLLPVVAVDGVERRLGSSHDATAASAGAGGGYRYPIGGRQVSPFHRDYQQKLQRRRSVQTTHRDNRDEEDLINMPIRIDFDDLGSQESESASIDSEDVFIDPEEGKFVDTRFEGIDIFVSGYIPPDPSGVAGRNSVISVINSEIEARSRDGEYMWGTPLFRFFESESPRSDYIFDPKIVYDPHEDRFVIVALHTTSSRSYSYTFVAVSKSGDPRGPTTDDWYYLKMDSLVDGNWADYPGLAVDEEAIYITSNMFSASDFFQRSLLWIVEKGSDSDGLYDGGAADYGYYDFAEDGYWLTYQPALIRDPRGAGSGIGTYLVCYDSSNTISVVRVNDPIGGNPKFTRDLVYFDIEGMDYFLPDAEQLGNDCNIDTVGTRIMNAVWTDDTIWLAMAISIDSRATAHWVKLDTSRVTSSSSPAGRVELAGIGSAKNEDIASEAHTFFPSIAVNNRNVAVLGFSGSASTIYAGAYAAVFDSRGKMQATEVVRSGRGPYQNGSCFRNRWGDYSGSSVDPRDEDCFWVFHEYALPCGTENCWGTAWARICFSDDDGPDDDCKKGKGKGGSKYKGIGSSKAGKGKGKGESCKSKSSKKSSKAKSKSSKKSSTAGSRMRKGSKSKNSKDSSNGGSRKRKGSWSKSSKASSKANSLKGGSKLDTKTESGKGKSKSSKASSRKRKGDIKSESSKGKGGRSKSSKTSSNASSSKSGPSSPSSPSSHSWSSESGSSPSSPSSRNSPSSPFSSSNR